MLYRLARMRNVFIGVVVGVSLAGGCVVQTPGSGGLTRYGGESGSSSTQAHGDPASDGRVVAASGGRVTMPDVFGLTQQQAEARFHQAGVQGSISYDNSQCEDSVVHGRVMERGMVCYQSPSPGTVQGEHLPVTMVVQTEDPWHGNIGKVTEWRLMPKLVGLSVEAARAEMKHAGFTAEDNVTLEYSEGASCRPDIVCAVYPSELSRVGVHSTKTIRAGRPPASAATVSEAADPTSEEPAHSTPARPEADHASQPTTAAQPFF